MLNKLFHLLRRREMFAVCLMIFAADLVTGIITPGFSLYAIGMGANLTLIGALGSIEGLTRILSSMPIGVLSDSHGRKAVLSGGMLLFVISSYLFTVVQAPVFFFPIRVMVGMAMVCTFFVGVAYVADVTAPEERGLAFGLFATFMGSGFVIGSAVGGQVTVAAGYRAGCLVAAAVALAGLIIARVGLATKPKSTADGAKAGALPLRAQLALLREPHLLAASVANLANNAWYGSTISFFPVYAASLAVGEGTLGTMFALRALMSTAARLPTGLLTTRIPSRRLVLISFGLALLVFGAMAGTSVPWLLGLLLAVEGVAYGIFLPSGQAYVSEQCSEASRGSAVGIFSTAGGIGSTGGPLLLGLIADLWGVRAVFWATALLVAVGLGLVWIIGLRHPAPIVSAHEVA
ncbi:MAG TPA: MFS transporter [Anaerolineae bacterium]|nr:MFS transporter [Anaerolineae bacterium]HOQ99070.1 MFS transporter [Anaerolineae bacterium]HPL28887.1 MFS transporter [Anaerolineae bacterium]